MAWWELVDSLRGKKNPWWESLDCMKMQEKHDNDEEKPETSKRMLMINGILERLKKLRDDTEKKELDQERAEKLKSRIDKIVRQLHKLQSEESGSDSESESEYESESESQWEKYEEWEREKEQEMEPVEEVSLESDDPYKLKRPKTRTGEIHFGRGGYRLLYEPAFTGKNPKTMKYLQHSAKLAIDFFNKRNNTNTAWWM